MKNLKVDEEDLDEEVAGDWRQRRRCRSASAPARGRKAERPALTEILSGFKAAAMNVLNFTTYFEMKARAGTVGKNGVAQARSTSSRRRCSASTWSATASADAW